MGNGIPVYADKHSQEVTKHIELSLFTFFFQELYKALQIDRCYYKDGSIVALDTYGDEESNII